MTDLLSNLTPKQKAFTLHYVQCLNATEAARRAGYSGDDNALAVRGYENVRNSKIKAAINELMAEYALSPEEVMGRFTAQARADIADLLDPTTMTLDLRKAIDMGKSHLIKKIKQTVITKDDEQTEYFELELYDAQKALAHMGKIYAMFTDRVQVDDWHSQAIEDIKAGNISFDALAQAFDDDLATQLFRKAGVNISPE